MIESAEYVASFEIPSTFPIFQADALRVTTGGSAYEFEGPFEADVTYSLGMSNAASFSVSVVYQKSGDPIYEMSLNDGQNDAHTGSVKLEALSYDKLSTINLPVIYSGSGRVDVVEALNMIVDSVRGIEGVGQLPSFGWLPIVELK